MNLRVSGSHPDTSSSLRIVGAALLASFAAGVIALAAPACSSEHGADPPSNKVPDSYCITDPKPTTCAALSLDEVNAWVDEPVPILACKSCEDCPLPATRQGPWDESYTTVYYFSDPMCVGGWCQYCITETEEEDPCATAACEE